MQTEPLRQDTSTSSPQRDQRSTALPREKNGKKHTLRKWTELCRRVSGRTVRDDSGGTEKYKSQFLRSLHDGLHGRQDAEEVERSRWIQKHASLITNVPSGGMLVAQPTAWMRAARVEFVRSGSSSVGCRHPPDLLSILHGAPH